MRLWFYLRELYTLADEMYVAQVWDQLMAVVNTAMNLRVP
jgi:hypothetical protein